MQSLDPITPITGCRVEQRHFTIFQRSTVTGGALGLHGGMEEDAPGENDDETGRQS